MGILKKWKKHLPSSLKSERGAQAIEYIAIGLVALALVSTILGYINSNKDDIGETFVERITTWVSQLGSDSGGSGGTGGSGGSGGSGG